MAKPLAAGGLLETGAFQAGGDDNKKSTAPEAASKALAEEADPFTATAKAKCSKASKVQTYQECKAKILAMGKSSSPSVATQTEPNPTQIVQTDTVLFAQTGPQCPTDSAVAEDSPARPTRGVPTGTFTVATTAQVQLATSALGQATGCGTADTVLWLIRCTTSDCHAGDVVAVDDDDGVGLASYIELALGPGHYRWLVHSFNESRCGTMTITVSVAGQSVLADPLVARPFGGLPLATTLAAGDTVLAGMNPRTTGTPTPNYRDSVLFAFTAESFDCDTEPCGQFARVDDSYYGYGATLLSRWEVPSTWPTGITKIVAGTYDWGAQPTLMPIRIMALRRHTDQGGVWACPTSTDLDQDGLTREVEDAIGSCDERSAAIPASSSGVGVVGMTCAAYADLVDQLVAAPADNVGGAGWGTGGGHPECLPGGAGGKYCWNAADSDNDGLRDDIEAWAARASCSGLPAPPYYDEPQCFAVTPQENQACAGAYCAIEDVSGWDKPLPDRYDVFTLGDPFVCSAATCTNWHMQLPGGGHTHSATADTQADLDVIWTTDGDACYVGGLLPDGRCADDPVRDLRYKAKYHIFTPTNTYAIGDDSTWDELYQGWLEDAWFANRFTGPARWLRLMRYGLLAHNGGGGMSGGFRRKVFVGNDRTISGTVDIAHETGHMLTLSHPHRRNDMCNGSGGCEVSCQDRSTCSTTPFVCNSGSQRSCSNTDVINPNVPSLMSYHYLAGMRGRSDAPPSTTTPGYAGCSRINSRFSKGLNPPLDENALPELMVAGPASPQWLLKKRINELACFGGGANEFCATPPAVAAFRSTYGFQPGLGAGTLGPYCVPGGTECAVNWSQSGELVPVLPVAADVSYGVYYGPVQNMCISDVLRDVDEWGRMVAMGRWGLLDDKAVRDLVIYRDSFNAAAAVNSAPWGDLLAVSSQGAYASVEVPYRVNACDPLDPSCTTDSCSGAGDCAAGQACDSATGRCTCLAHFQCRSGTCDLTAQKCEGSGAARACSTNLQCSGAVCNIQPGNPIGFCAGSRTWLNPPAVDATVASRYVKSFSGPGQSNEIRVAPGWAGNPLVTIAERDTYWLGLDFYFRGFAQGQAEQVLAQSGSYRVALSNRIEGPQLLVSTGAQTLAFPAWAVQLNAWYRVRIGYALAQNRFFARVMPWNTDTGWYHLQDSPQGSDCYWVGATAQLPEHGSLILGWDGTRDQSRFNGYMDNVGLFNYFPSPSENQTMTANCQEVLP